MCKETPNLAFPASSHDHRSLPAFAYIFGAPQVNDHDHGTTSWKKGTQEEVGGGECWAKRTALVFKLVSHLGATKSDMSASSSRVTLTRIFVARKY